MYWPAAFSRGFKAGSLDFSNSQVARVREE
jgi:hypothetical protein